MTVTFENPTTIYKVTRFNGDKYIKTLFFPSFAEAEADARAWSDSGGKLDSYISTFLGQEVASIKHVK